MRILLLGGYGLIGGAILRELLTAGHAVTALGRSASQGMRLDPRIAWITADMATLCHAREWEPHLRDVDAIVNAAGALQDGPRDDLERVHHLAVAALVEACASRGPIRLVHISAPDARPDSTTHFMRSKARGDDAMRRSATHWIILRPGLVIGPNAYGGSALLRALAAFPAVIPLAFAQARVQVVAMDDVTAVVREAVEGRIPLRTDVALVEDESHTLREIVARFRAWMGLRPARIVAVPTGIARLVSRIADGLGRLGWRSPLRTTAMLALAKGVVADPAPLRALRGRGLRSLDEALGAMPATAQERWFARAWLLMPLVVATLSAFWIASGAIALMDVDRAASLVPIAGPGAAATLVIGGAVLDVALGIAILARPFARAAALAMAATSIIYVTAGSILMPGLWLDPLGPYVKVIPSIVLALVAGAMLEER